MTKVLFIHHASGMGGAPINMINIINGLDKSKFSCYVLLLKNSSVADILNENQIPYSVVNSKFYSRYYSYFIHSEANFVKWYQIYRFIKLLTIWILSRNYFASKELNKYNFDIIHLNSSVLTDWLKPASKRGKVVINIQEPFRKGHIDFLHYFFRNQYSKYSDKIIAISKDNALRINLAKKTIVIYNFLSYFPVEPNDLSYSSKCILYLGGSEYIKGFYTMVDSLPYLNPNVIVYFGGNYELNLATKSKYKTVIKNLFKIGSKKKKYLQKLLNSKNTVIFGYKNNVYEYFEKTVCLVSPFSTPHFSRPIIESYLHRKPVITTNIPGMDEIVLDGKTGIIVKKNDPIALAAAINHIASNPTIAKIMGTNAYNFGKTKFTLQNVKQFEYTYFSLLTNLKEKY